MAWNADFIDTFMDWTSALPTPEVFRLWAAISCVSGALERRVFANVTGKTVIPNLYIMLVAPPGIGKTVSIDIVRDLWRATKMGQANGKLYVAPNSVSKASLLDELTESSRRIITAGGGLIEYNYLSVAASEFGVLVPAYDHEFLNVLNDVFDNPPGFRDRKRTSKSVDIVNPSLNIICGCQPGFLASILPETAWSMGFMSRMVMIYSRTSPKIKIHVETEDGGAYDKGSWTSAEGRKSLLEMLGQMTSLTGSCKWTATAAEEVKRWHANDLDPVPEHSKLEHYNQRRFLLFVKLCQLSAVSRTGALLIDMADVQRVRDWMLHAEQLMPDVFRDMVGRSDGAVLQELHMFIFRMFSQQKKPIHRSALVHFLHTRVPGEKIEKLIKVMEEANMVSRMAGTELYVPKGRHQWGTIE